MKMDLKLFFFKKHSQSEVEALIGILGELLASHNAASVLDLDLAAHILFDELSHSSHR